MCYEIEEVVGVILVRGKGIGYSNDNFYKIFLYGGEIGIVIGCGDFYLESMYFVREDLGLNGIEFKFVG